MGCPGRASATRPFRHCPFAWTSRFGCCDFRSCPATSLHASPLRHYVRAPFLVITLSVAFAAAPSSPPGPLGSDASGWENGLWFDAARFSPRTIYEQGSFARGEIASSATQDHLER